MKQVTDINGQLILRGDEVRPAGNCQKTKELHSITGDMRNIINNNKYYTVLGSPQKTRICFEGYNWHPLDVEVKRNLIKSEPIKSEKFDPNNLNI